jgi:serine/threonine protein kinase
LSFHFAALYQELDLIAHNSQIIAMETVAEEDSIHLSRDDLLPSPSGGRDPEKELMETTRRYLNQVTENSKLFQKLPAVPSLNPAEIQIGEVLGAGQFGLVCLVESINMLHNGNASISSLMRNAAAAAHGSFCKVDQFDMSSSPGHHHIIDFEALPEIKPIRHEGQFEKSFATSSVTFTNAMLSSFEVSASSLPDFTEATFCEDDLEDTEDDEFVKLEDIPRHLSRSNLAASTRRDGQPRYALKAVKPDIGKSKRKMAIIDLASEALYLRALHHTNIIRLRATVGSPGSPDYGLFLDRLTCTLQEKLSSWADEYGPYSQLYGNSCSCKQPPVDTVLFRERLVICLDIARALCHIHNHSVVYRDLKPGK